MRLKMEFDTTMPIYLQIMEEIKRQIVSGERLPGSKMEAVRELAQEMGVNPNTMQRALAELEREDLLFTERTAGRFITSDTGRISRVREEAVRSLVNRFLATMRKSGFSDEDTVRMVKQYAEEGEHGHID